MKDTLGCANCSSELHHNPIPLSSGIISKAPPVWPPYPDAPPKAVKKTKASAGKVTRDRKLRVGWSFECLQDDFGSQMSRVSTCTNYYDCSIVNS